MRSPEKKIFFANKLFFAILCETIHISAKITIFWDHLKKIIFWQKIGFCLYLPNYTHFGKTNDILRSLEKKLIYCPKIVVHISAKITIFWDQVKNNIFFQKIVFWFSLPNYTHFGKNNDILRSPEKKFYFCQKIVLCLYLPKYTHFGKNNDILRSPEKKIFFAKKSFFAFICQNIHFSANIRIFWDHMKKK